MRFRHLIMPTLLFVSACATTSIKDIGYTQGKISDSLRLNIFVSKHPSQKMPVLIFIHGGNWNTGNKKQYGFFGRNFAKKGVVAVIPDYTLSPDTDYDGMAREVAAAIRWTKENISKYNGDPDPVYITGHSAGGHLAALAAMNPKYGVRNGTLAGIILNDAAGLDMKHYLDDHPPTELTDYLTTWTKDPETWRDASPIYFVNDKTPPLMIYLGDKTYESIREGNERFLEVLHPFQPDVKIISVNKSHIPMILQYISPGSKRFEEVKGFMKAHGANFN